MTNNYFVCLIALFCCASLSSALPKECHKGPSVWCNSIKQGSDCGAVGHCIATLWEKRNDTVSTNGISNKFIRLFRQLKDVKELINEDYLSTKIASACDDIQHPDIKQTCADNTRDLHEYIFHVLQSETTPETMCSLIKMCNNDKIDDVLLGRKRLAGKGKLLGAAHCTWGPSYWCSNFSTGRECQATHHCVKRVWSKMAFPEDNDSICKICTDMVQQARDQLQSNETQEELKEVFEGSCQLIPIKAVAKECMKLADDFVPELVETLASQMNPQAVCSVAGLCNNAKIDRLLEDFNTQLQLRVECNNCQRTVGGLRKKFDSASDEDFLVGLLQVCGKMNHLSDSCSMLVFKYYENIVAALRKDLTPQSLCHVSGQCAHKYHSHNYYTFPIDFTDYKDSDDVPCELCQQLVKHLRDVIVANTTEVEFYKVLKGLCKQTGNFKDECLHLAEEYYPIVYNYLVKELDANEICAMVGVCGNKTQVGVVAPLVTHEIAVKAITMAPQLTSTNKANSYKTEQTTAAPLPIERMFVYAPQVEGKTACSFCQYFLHYLQVEISNTKSEDEIIQAVDKACDKLPSSVNAECKQFVSQYGPSVIALLVQSIDPASICPSLGICPKTEEIRHVEVNSEKSNCPLCLFAVEQLETVLKNNRSVEQIRHALDNLCTHLSTKLRSECEDFVDTYTEQLVEMLVAKMDAQEICVYLQLCDAEVKTPIKTKHGQIDKYHEKPQLRGDRNNFRKKSMLPAHMLVQHKDIETNEIFDNTVNGRTVRPPVTQKTVCVVCEFVLKEIDDEIKDKHNEDEIKKVIHNVCKRMPKTIRSECDNFVEKYADMVISLLAQELDPQQVCAELKLCDSTNLDVVKETKEIFDDSVNGRTVRRPVTQKTVCVVCEFVLKEIDDEIKDKYNEDKIKKVIENVCKRMPKTFRSECDNFVENYAEMVIALLAQELRPQEICAALKLCDSTNLDVVKGEILDCAVCETVIMAVRKVLSNDKIDHDIVHIVEKSCGLLPAKYNARCHTMMEIYGDSVIHLIEEYGTKGVCQKIGLCSPSDSAYVHMYREKRV